MSACANRRPTYAPQHCHFALRHRPRDNAPPADHARSFRRNFGIGERDAMSAAGEDANGDFHFAIPPSAKPIVKVENCALDRAGRLQGLLGGLRCVAFEAEQRADAIELDVAERAVRPRGRN